MLNYIDNHQFNFFRKIIRNVIQLIKLRIKIIKKECHFLAT